MKINQIGRKEREAEIALIYAIRNGRLTEVKNLLEGGVDPNAFDDKSRNFRLAFNALCVAVDAAAATISEDHVAISRFLQKTRPAEAAPNPQREREASLDILRLLLASGADPNGRTLSRTPLSLAVFLKDMEVIALLLDAGANPDSGSWSPFSKLPRPKGGLAFYGSALHEAAECGATEVVQLLCSRGSDKSARNHEGKTALQIAEERGLSGVVHVLERHMTSQLSGAVK